MTSAGECVRVQDLGTPDSKNVIWPSHSHDVPPCSPPAHPTSSTHPWYFPPSNVSLKSCSPEAQVLDLRRSAACSLKQREAFPSSGCDLSISVLFFFRFPLLKFCLTSSGHRSRASKKSQIKAFRDAEAPDSESSTARLCPPNWHAASTSFCQSNKLMLSGIDCLLLMVAGFHATHWGN